MQSRDKSDNQRSDGEKERGDEQRNESLPSTPEEDDKWFPGIEAFRAAAKRWKSHHSDSDSFPPIPDFTNDWPGRVEWLLTTDEFDWIDDLPLSKDELDSSCQLLELAQQDNDQFWGTFSWIVREELNSLDDIPFLNACRFEIHQKPMISARERITEVILEYERYEIAHALKDL